MNQPDFIHESREFYDRTLRSEYGQPRGTKPSQVTDFERRRGLILPAAYQQFLRWMGDDDAGPLAGSEWFFKDLDNNNDLLAEFLADNGVDFDEARRPFCFFSHQGYMVGWFYLDPGDPNPVSYFYSEGNEANAVLSNGRFSDFLLKDLGGSSKVATPINPS